MATRPLVAWGVALGLGLATWAVVPDPVMARAGGLAVLALVLWLGEAVPTFLPTLLLVAAIPLAFPGDRRFALAPVLAAAAEPVLVLFLGGMVLAVAAARHGLDRALADHVLALAGGRPVRLVLTLMAATAFCSLWMSNIAAAAMMLTVVGPLCAGRAANDPLRRAALVGIACAANLGGMGTPIGSGPNAIAMNAVALHGGGLTFAGWMGVGLPAVALGLLATGALIHVRYGLGTLPPLPAAPAPGPLTTGGRRVLLAAGLLVAAWLTEPLHRVPAPVVAMGGAAGLFATGLLAREDLRRVDWDTLLLIAGGLIVGDLLADAGVLTATAQALAATSWAPAAVLTVLLLLAAVGAALMSNTATATLLVPLALAVDPSPGTAVLIALACSLGFPFTISTPPNALVAAQGVRATDLLLPGLVVMLVGCTLLAWWGPGVMGWYGLGR